MHLKCSSAKWRPFCLGLNVLKHWTQCVHKCVLLSGFYATECTECLVSILLSLNCACRPNGVTDLVLSRLSWEFTAHWNLLVWINARKQKCYEHYIYYIYIIYYMNIASTILVCYQLIMIYFPYVSEFFTHTTWRICVKLTETKPQQTTTQHAYFVMHYI